MFSSYHFLDLIKVLFLAQVDFIGQRVAESNVYYIREWRRFNGFPERPLFADRTSQSVPVQCTLYIRKPSTSLVNHSLNSVFVLCFSWAHRSKHYIIYIYISRCMYHVYHRRNVYSHAYKHYIIISIFI